MDIEPRRGEAAELPDTKPQEVEAQGVEAQGSEAQESETKAESEPADPGAPALDFATEHPDGEPRAATNEHGGTPDMEPRMEHRDAERPPTPANP